MKKGAAIVKGGFILVHEKTGKPAKYGERVSDFRGDKTTLHDASPPAAEGKSGYAYVGAAKADEFARARYYVDVFDLKWIPAGKAIRAMNPTKRKRKRAAKKNPGPGAAYVIVMRSASGQRLTYDANARRFSDGKKPALYRTQLAAKQKAQWLIAQYPFIARFKITIEEAKADERGSVFGARPLTNPSAARRRKRAPKK